MGAHYLTAHAAMELEERMRKQADQDPVLDSSIFKRELALLLLVEAHGIHQVLLKRPNAGAIAFSIAETPKRSHENRLQMLVWQDGQWRAAQPQPDNLNYINNQLATLRGLAARDWVLGAAFRPEKAAAPGQLLFTCDPADLGESLVHILDPETFAFWQAGRLRERLDCKTASAAGKSTAPRL